MNRPSAFERVASGPLRLLTAFGGHELTEKLGLRDISATALKTAAKTVASTATTLNATINSKLAPARTKKASKPALFDLSLSEEQQMLKDTVRRFANEVIRPAAHAADEAGATPAEILEAAHGIGLAGLVIPEALGGAAETRSSLNGVIITEELARGDMAIALAILAPLSVVNAIVDWGSRAQQERWLPLFQKETFVPAAFALLEGHTLFEPMRLRTGATRSKRGGFVLNGEKTLVPLAETAQLFVVAAEIKGAGPKLFLVEKGTPGVTVRPEPAMGLRAASLGRVRFENVELGPEALLGGEEGALRELDLGDVVDRARIAWGAMAVGTSQAVVEYVIQYANDRKAFGEPISHRQTVAFMIADLAIETEGMRLLVLRAASLADTGKSVAREAAQARRQCATKAMKIGTDGVQLLGGHGFIKEHPVERWYRDLRAIGVMEGALLA